MSEPVSALNGASWSGGIADVAETGPEGMITLRGDITSRAFARVAKDVAGVAVPAPGQATFNAVRGLCWMSPDELLLLCPYADAPEDLAKLSAALQGTHHLAANVSDARALFRLSGPNAREVMAKLAPVDLAPGAFEPGMFRRSRLAQVPAAFWMTDPHTFRIVCFRSVAQYVFDLLKTAAQPGSAVGYFE
jgi:sarcosine oxidase subunit gamma